MKFKSLMLTILFSVLSIEASSAESSLQVKGATSIDATQAKKLFDAGALFIDVRKDKDWAVGRVPDAVHIELKKKFNESALNAEAKIDEDIVIYCNGFSCLRSSEATEMAVSWGYTNIYYFRSGFPAWKTAGFPVE